MENGGVGQRVKPKFSASKAFDLSGEEDNSNPNNWYGKLKGMSNSLKKLAQPKKRFSQDSQASQGLGRVLSFNTSKSVDHDTSSSKKELAATNLRGPGYNSLDLSCGISRGLNIAPTGGNLPRRKGKSLELQRDVPKVDASPFFSKSKIPIVKSNFVKEAKEDPGGHEYQRLALVSDSEDEPGAADHPESTSLEYESSLANRMLMEQLGSGPEDQIEGATTQEEMEQQIFSDMNGTRPLNTVSSRHQAPGKRLDISISGPGPVVAEGVGGAGQKPVKASSNGEASGTGWPLKRLAGVGSGSSLYNGKVKSAGGNDKKATSVVVEAANAGIKGKGAGTGSRKNIKSMSGELFMLKSSKKSGGVDPVVPARKSVSDIPSRNASVPSKDSTVKRQQVEAVRPLPTKKADAAGMLSEFGRGKKPAQKVASKKPGGGTGETPARKSVDLGKEFKATKPFSAQQLSGENALSEPVRINANLQLSPPTARTLQGSRPQSVQLAKVDQHVVDHPGVSIPSSEEGGSPKDGVGRGKKEGDAVHDHSESKGRSPVASSTRGITGEASLVGVVDSSAETRKSVQDLIRELERNAAHSHVAGSGKAPKHAIETPTSTERFPDEGVKGEGECPDGGMTDGGISHTELEARADDEQREEATNGISTFTSSPGREGSAVDLNDASLRTMFTSVSITRAQQNNVLEAELSESFEELHHKLKIDLDPKVVQDIHRTFNLGLVQAVAAASAGESAIWSKPNAEVTTLAQSVSERVGGKQLPSGDNNRRKSAKSVAPPRALGAAAYSNKIIEGLAGPAGTAAKPSAVPVASRGDASADLAMVEVRLSSVELSSSSANPIRDIVPVGYPMDEAGNNQDTSVQDNSLWLETLAEVDAGMGDPDHLPEGCDDEMDLVQAPRSSGESPEVRILSSTSSNKMLTTENFHRVAARLVGHKVERSLPQTEQSDRDHEVASEPVDIPRSSMDSVDMRSSTSSNKMLNAKNFPRVAALLNEYNAELKAGLVSQPRAAGGRLDSSSSSFNRLEPMLDDLEMSQTAGESASEADRTITKQVVPDSANYSRVAQHAYAVNTPPSSSRSNDSSGAQSRTGPGPVVASRYRNVDYSPKVQTKLGRRGSMAAESGSETSTARRSLDLQFRSQLSDPYYRKPKQSKHAGAPLSSGSSSAHVDRNGTSKRGRARSPSATISISSSKDVRIGQLQGRDSDPKADLDIPSQGGEPALRAKAMLNGRSRGGRRNNRVTSPPTDLTLEGGASAGDVLFREKHHLSRPEYIDEADDTDSVWIDNGRVLNGRSESLGTSGVSEPVLSVAAKRLQNSGLRPHDNLSYNGDLKSRKARSGQGVRPNFSGPLVYYNKQDGDMLEDEESGGSEEWPKSGPIIPASVLREIYDDRDISDDQGLVVDNNTFSAGVMRGGSGKFSRSGALYFSGPLVSQTIRNSKLVHSGPPSSVSGSPLLDRLSKMGRFSRSASAKLRETEGIDMRRDVGEGDNGAAVDQQEDDSEPHESYAEHQHEYLIQDHEQLYQYLDQYSHDHHSFLDQYIADQLHELSLQQDLHEILSDQLEKVQASATAGKAADAGSSSLDSTAKTVEVPADKEDIVDILRGRGGQKGDKGAKHDDDGHLGGANGTDASDVEMLTDADEEGDMLSAYSSTDSEEDLELPESAADVHDLELPDTGGTKRLSVPVQLVINASDGKKTAIATGTSMAKEGHVAPEDLALPEAATNDSLILLPYQHDPGSSTREVSDGWRSPRDTHVTAAEKLTATRLGRQGYMRSSSSKSLTAVVADQHQDSLQRSTISSRAKSKQYNGEESTSSAARSGGHSGYESDRNAGDYVGKQRLRGGQDFMNTSIQSEPGGIRRFLSQSRGANSAHTSPARGSFSGSRNRNYRGGGGGGGEDAAKKMNKKQTSGQFDSSSPSVVLPSESSVQSPRPSNRTSFPSLYLMQVSSSSSSTPQPAMRSSAPTKSSGSTVNRQLRPPSRNLLTQNIATISMEDLSRPDRRSTSSAKPGSGSGPAASFTRSRPRNSPLMKGPSSVSSQKSSPTPQNDHNRRRYDSRSDFLNSSIQSEPGISARTLLLNLESQNKTSGGRPTSLNPEQISRVAAATQTVAQYQESSGRQLEHPPRPLASSSSTPPPSAGVNGSRGGEQSMTDAKRPQPPTETSDDQSSLIDDSASNSSRDEEDVEEEPEDEDAVQAPDDHESYEHTGSSIPPPGPSEKEAKEDDGDDDDRDSQAYSMAVTVTSTVSVGAFRREALKMFGVNRAKDADELSLDLLSNLDTRSTRLLSEHSYYMGGKQAGDGGATAEGLPDDLHDTVATKRSDLEKLCEGVDPCLDFQSAIVDMILEKDDMNDLLDLEEFLNSYLCLREPYQGVVRQFFGELCEATFVY